MRYNHDSVEMDYEEEPFAGESSYSRWERLRDVAGERPAGDTYSLLEDSTGGEGLCRPGEPLETVIPSDRDVVEFFAAFRE